MQKFSWIFVILAIFLGFGGFLIWKLPKSATIDTTGNTLYFSSMCTECQALDQFLTEHHVSDKLTIIHKEIAVPEHLVSLKAAVAHCQLDSTSGIGVPFLFAEGQCYVGAPAVTEYVRQKLGIVAEETDSAPITAKK